MELGGELELDNTLTDKITKMDDYISIIPHSSPGYLCEVFIAQAPND